MPDDWPTLDDGEPVPETGKGTPCSECVKQGEPCSRYGHDGSETKQGRPSHYNETTKERILGAAKVGANQAGCARAAGISPKTLEMWLRAGRRGEEPFDEFSRAYARARSEVEQDLLLDTQDRDPKWILERSFKYWKKEQREHTGPGGDPIQVETLTDELADVDPDLAERVLAKLGEAA